MSAGEHLDTAAVHLQTAASDLAGKRQIDNFILYAGLTARDQLYADLAQLMRVLNFRFPGPQLTLADANRLTERARATGEGHDLALAAAINIARIDMPDVPRDTLRGQSEIAGQIASACDAINAVADTVAAHYGQPDNGSPGRGHRYLTREAATLLRGEQCGETTAEIARLAQHTIHIDQQLLRFRQTHPFAIHPSQWDQLENWVNSTSSAQVTEIAAAGYGTLLRDLGVAPLAEWPTEPRAIQSWAGVTEAVALTRTAIRSDPMQVTAKLIRATARLGFAATAAAWRIAGTPQPSQRLQELGNHWRSVAQAFESVADIRDGIASPISDEIDRAHDWIRQRSTGKETPTPTDIDAVLAVHQQLSSLADELQLPLQAARAQGELLTLEMVLGQRRTAGISLAQPRWKRATADDSRFAVAAQAIRQAAGQPPPTRADLTDPATTPHNANRISSAWPTSIHTTMPGTTKPASQAVRPPHAANRQPETER